MKRVTRGLISQIIVMIFAGIFCAIPIVVLSLTGGAMPFEALLFLVIPVFLFVGFLLSIITKTWRAIQLAITFAAGREVRCDFVETVVRNPIVRNAFVSYHAVRVEYRTVRNENRYFTTPGFYSQAEVDYLAGLKSLSALMYGKYLVITEEFPEELAPDPSPAKDILGGMTQKFTNQFAKQYKLTELKKLLPRAQTAAQKRLLLLQYRNDVYFADIETLEKEIEPKLREELTSEIDSTRGYYEKLSVVYKYYRNEPLDLHFELRREIRNSESDIEVAEKKLYHNLHRDLPTIIALTDALDFLIFFHDDITAEQFEWLLGELHSDYSRRGTPEKAVLDDLGSFIKRLKSIDELRKDELWTLQKPPLENLPKALMFHLKARIDSADAKQ